MHELTIALGSDLREPRWVQVDDELMLFFAQLGVSPLRFEPKGIWRSRLGAGGWSGPHSVDLESLVPWRIKNHHGRWMMSGYRNAKEMYSARPVDPVVEIRISDDALNFSNSTDLWEGGTEFDWVQLGGIVGVSRNEGPTRRGSDLLWWSGKDLIDTPPQQVVKLDQKLDSPNLFVWRERVFLIARRSLGFGGRYRLAPDWVSPGVRIRVDQAIWSATRKRSALYEIDTAVLREGHDPLRHLLDLPSVGDCSFASVIQDRGDLVVVDYTSPIQGPDRCWARGQLGPTEIWMHRLRL